MAASLVPKGVAVAAVEYTIAPKGYMDLMVYQVRQSVLSIAQMFPQTSGLYLCGHSAGAHLVAMVLSTDWSQFSTTSPCIKGAFLVSGIYDLEPIVSTYVNDPIKMTKDIAFRNSPFGYVHHLKTFSSDIELVIVMAQHDSPEFRRQSVDYFMALNSLGLNVTIADIPSTDHFSVIEKLVDVEYYLTKLLLKMMSKT